MAAEDVGAVEEIAHWLKGAGGTAGFHAFTEPARSLGTAIRNSRFAEAQRISESIESMAGQIEIGNESC